jgi:hypothetical protein
LKKPSNSIDLQNKLIKISPRCFTPEILVEIIEIDMEESRKAFVGTWSFDSTFGRILI